METIKRLLHCEPPRLLCMLVSDSVLGLKNSTFDKKITVKFYATAPSVADPHNTFHFAVDPDSACPSIRNRIEIRLYVACWIRMRMKLILIRNPVYLCTYFYPSPHRVSPPTSGRQQRHLAFTLCFPFVPFFPCSYLGYSTVFHLCLIVLVLPMYSSCISQSPSLPIQCVDCSF